MKKEKNILINLKVIKLTFYIKINLIWNKLNYYLMENWLMKERHGLIHMIQILKLIMILKK